MNIEAIKYLSHIKPHHMEYSGEQLAFNNIGCPSCNSKLVKRNKKGTDTMFIACDKSNKPYCEFSIGLNETLYNRTQRIYMKLRHRDLIIIQEDKQLQGNTIQEL
jgi:ssDNA-binding Zn-finger/Zn-ribbon topoisomerase 1